MLMHTVTPLEHTCSSPAERVTIPEFTFSAL